MELKDILQIAISFGSLVVTVIALRRINVVKHTFNSRMEEFITLIKKTSRAEGVKEGREETK